MARDREARLAACAPCARGGCGCGASAAPGRGAVHGGRPRTGRGLRSRAARPRTADATSPARSASGTATAGGHDRGGACARGRLSLTARGTPEGRIRICSPTCERICKQHVAQQHLCVNNAGLVPWPRSGRGLYDSAIWQKQLSARQLLWRLAEIPRSLLRVAAFHGSARRPHEGNLADGKSTQTCARQHPRQHRKSANLCCLSELVPPASIFVHGHGAAAEEPREEGGDGGSRQAVKPSASCARRTTASA